MAAHETGISGGLVKVFGKWSGILGGFAKFFRAITIAHACLDKLANIFSATIRSIDIQSIVSFYG